MQRQVWAGVDAGKMEHHCVVVDSEGNKLLSRRVANDEPLLRELIESVAELADGGEATWAIDLNSGGAALLIALLTEREERLLYIPGHSVHHASVGYRGGGKTDAKDAAIIADQARMRRDLNPLRVGDEVTADLRELVSRRADLAEDRCRVVNRLRGKLNEHFPALERAFDYAHSKAALTLLTGYQTPEAIRRVGVARLEAWLRARGAYKAAQVAQKAVAAAHAQRVTVPGHEVAALLIAKLAKEMIALDGEIAETDAMIEERFRNHQHAETILSMPGFGVLLAAEFLAATGGDMTLFDGPDRLAGAAGLAPVPKDSGRVSGNLKRPMRFNRRLLRVFYISAMNSTQTDPASRTYYDRKRAEGKRHSQAVICLARRRVNVLWAMLRDNTPYRDQPTVSIAA